MAIISIFDFWTFINQQIETQEQVETCLWKLEALITVVLTTNNFYDLSEWTLHNYFSVVGDLIEEAVKVNQMSLNDLLQQGR